MKSLLFFGVPLILLMLFSSFTCSSTKSLYMENPATSKCIKDGGSFQLVSSKEGNYGVCIFSDGSVCEEWEYFRGKCSAGVCMKQCARAGTENEGWYDCSGYLIIKEKCANVNK